MMTTALLDTPSPTRADVPAHARAAALDAALDAATDSALDDAAPPSVGPATAPAPGPGPAPTPAVEPYEPSDREAFVRLFGRLSRASVHGRYFTLMPRLNGRMLSRLLDDVDHLHHELLVVRDGDEIVAEARYIRLSHDPTGAEVAITVEDARQGAGLALVALRQLSRLARRRGIRYFTFTVLAENAPALGLVHRMAPNAQATRDGTEVNFRAPLCPDRPSPTTTAPA